MSRHAPCDPRLGIDRHAGTQLGATGSIVILFAHLLGCLAVTGMLVPVDEGSGFLRGLSMAFPLTYSLEVLNSWMFGGALPSGPWAIAAVLAGQTVAYAGLAWLVEARARMEPTAATLNVKADGPSE